MFNLGIINFPDLAQYTWTAENFKQFSEYLTSDLRAYISTQYEPGILSGCVPSFDAAMNVTISPGVILFSDQTLAYYKGETIGVEASDPTEDRYDRISLKLNVVNGTTVKNKALLDVTLNKFHEAVAVITKGVNSGSTPPLAVEEVSIASVLISAGVVTLNAGVINDSHKMRSLAKKVRDSKKYLIANDVDVNTNITNLKFDGTLLRAFELKFLIIRKDENQEHNCLGKFSGVFNDSGAMWTGEGQTLVDDSGVSLGISPTGQMIYQSSNYSENQYYGDIEILEANYIYKEV